MAGNRALTEVNRQRSALKSLIVDAENVTGQAASRSRALARLIASVHTTLGETASKTKHLDAGLQRLPGTVRRTRQILASLTRAAHAGRPLADELSRGAPALAAVTRSAPAFLGDAAAVLRRASPTVGLTARALRNAKPAIEAAPDRLVTGAFDIAPSVARLFTTLFGDDRMIRFMLGKISLAMSEPGAQPGYPAAYADRKFARGVGILTCELFGVEVRPGCLEEALGAQRSRRDTQRSRPTAGRQPKASRQAWTRVRERRSRTGRRCRTRPAAASR